MQLLLKAFLDVAILMTMILLGILVFVVIVVSQIYWLFIPLFIACGYGAWSVPDITEMLMKD